MKRRLLVAMTLLGVVAAAAVGLLSRPSPRVASAAGSGLTSIAAPRRHVLLFVGASYTASLGASSPVHGYPVRSQPNSAGRPTSTPFLAPVISTLVRTAMTPSLGRSTGCRSISAPG